jgi:hypothetical protein
MMSLEPGAVLVIFMYVGSLFVILHLSPRLTEPDPEPKPFWRNVRFWASFVALVQIVVYAVWS